MIKAKNEFIIVERSSDVSLQSLLEDDSNNINDLVNSDNGTDFGTNLTNIMESLEAINQNNYSSSATSFGDFIYITGIFNGTLAVTGVNGTINKNTNSVSEAKRSYPNTSIDEFMINNGVESIDMAEPVSNVKASFNLITLTGSPYVIKYDINGIPVWASKIGDFGLPISAGGVDFLPTFNLAANDEFVYLAGSLSIDWNLPAGIYNPDLGSQFVVQLSAIDGSFNFLKQIATNSTDQIYMSTIDNDLYISSNFGNNVTFDDCDLVTPLGKTLYLARLSSDGDWTWTIKANGKGIISVGGLITNGEGQAIIIGFYDNTIELDAQPTEFELINSIDTTPDSSRNLTSSGVRARTFYMTVDPDGKISGLIDYHPATTSRTKAELIDWFTVPESISCDNLDNVYSIIQYSGQWVVGNMVFNSITGRQNFMVIKSGPNLIPQIINCFSIESDIDDPNVRIATNSDSASLMVGFFNGKIYINGIVESGIKSDVTMFIIPIDSGMNFGQVMLTDSFINNPNNPVTGLELIYLTATTDSDPTKISLSAFKLT